MWASQSVWRTWARSIGRRWGCCSRSGIGGLMIYRRGIRRGLLRRLWGWWRAMRASDLLWLLFGFINWYIIVTCHSHQEWIIPQLLPPKTQKEPIPNPITLTIPTSAIVCSNFIHKSTKHYSKEKIKKNSNRRKKNRRHGWLNCCKKWAWIRGCWRRWWRNQKNWRNNFELMYKYKYKNILTL